MVKNRCIFIVLSVLVIVYKSCRVYSGGGGVTQNFHGIARHWLGEVVLRVLGSCQGKWVFERTIIVADRRKESNVGNYV